MSRRKYLYGNDGGMDTISSDVLKVRCPIWQCTGHLYLKFRKDKPENDNSAWQMPDIVCDDCGTVFANMLRVNMENRNGKST